MKIIMRHTLSDILSRATNPTKRQHFRVFFAPRFVICKWLTPGRLAMIVAYRVCLLIGCVDYQLGLSIQYVKEKGLFIPNLVLGSTICSLMQSNSDSKESLRGV